MQRLRPRACVTWPLHSVMGFICEGPGTRCPPPSAATIAFATEFFSATNTHFIGAIALKVRAGKSCCLAHNFALSIDFLQYPT